MSEQHIHHPGEQPYIEYQPSLLDKAAGFVGRVGMGQAGEEQSHLPADNYPDVNTLLDRYQVGGGPVSNLDPASQEAQRLIEQFQLSPRLESPLFLPNIMKAESSLVTRINVDPANPVHLPVRNFVHASGMKDWVRGRDGYKTDTASSRQTIRQYAKKTTPMPPIGFVGANVQPDGRVLYTSISDGAHRVAAAHLRGDEYIPVGSTILVHKLAQNAIHPNPR